MNEGRNYINYPGVANLLVGSHQNTDHLMETIINYVVSDTGITRAEILGFRRHKKTKEARQIFHYLANTMTENTLLNIGKFTNNSHCSVIHSVKIVNDVMSYDKKLVTKMINLKAAIESHLSQDERIKGVQELS
jgi:chromosomal replication initiation ATPase DnaA